ncbi:MAG: M23 family metallopeptidase [Clostridia bacterium]|nr:M23 family metallopeptidase [Clostridia bacterium]
MKKMQGLFLVIAAICVFLISFFIGRATALKDNDKQKLTTIYQGAIPFPNSFASQAIIEEDVSAKAKVLDETKDPREATMEKTKKPDPDRLIYPCGKIVLKEYSEAAVYSETMKDWRAHLGTDYSAEIGTDVKAAWEGTVTKVYKDKLYGYTVEISHSDSLVGVYSNLNKNIKVKKGENVKKSQIIGTVGRSASVESKEESHLHFELKLNGVTINPISYVY